MIWIIRRLLIIWLIFCVVCAAAIALGRLDHTPTTLQTLGFDTCDGDPCFRGLKPGMDWAKVQTLSNTSCGNCLEIQTLSLGGTTEIYPTDDKKYIRFISLSSLALIDKVSSISAGVLLSQYGPPCRVFLQYVAGDEPDSIILIYPNFEAFVDVVAADSSHSNDPRLRLTSQVTASISEQ